MMLVPFLSPDGDVVPIITANATTTTITISATIISTTSATILRADPSGSLCRRHQPSPSREVRLRPGIKAVLLRLTWDEGRLTQPLVGRLFTRLAHAGGGGLPSPDGGWGG